MTARETKMDTGPLHEDLTTIYAQVLGDIQEVVLAKAPRMFRPKPLTAKQLRFWAGALAEAHGVAITHHHDFLAGRPARRHKAHLDHLARY